MNKNIILLAVAGAAFAALVYSRRGRVIAKKSDVFGGFESVDGAVEPVVQNYYPEPSFGAQFQPEPAYSQEVSEAAADAWSNYSSNGVYGYQADVVDSAAQSAPVSAFQSARQEVEALFSKFTSGSNVQNLKPSLELQDMLKKGERLMLNEYELGDGGFTIGYGHFTPYASPSARIRGPLTNAQADALFAEDIEARAAKWVRAYVKIDLNQNQFDAMVHLAFNLSPRSFKTIADVLNVGGDWRAQALQYVRKGSNLERGLRIRRAREIALFETGVYA